MPHAELNFSNDLNIEAKVLLADIEALILKHDSGSGACKGRAYATDTFHHTHIMLDLAMLKKPHRDQAFSDALITALETLIKSRLNVRAYVSVALRFMDGNYYTGTFDPNAS